MTKKKDKQHRLEPPPSDSVRGVYDPLLQCDPCKDYRRHRFDAKVPDIGGTIINFKCLTCGWVRKWGME